MASQSDDSDEAREKGEKGQKGQEAVASVRRSDSDSTRSIRSVRSQQSNNSTHSIHNIRSLQSIRSSHVHDTKDGVMAGEKATDDSGNNDVADAPPNDGPPYSVHSTWAKRGIVLGASLGAFISPLTGQIYLPALNAIAQDLHITASQVNLTITTYMVFQGITPMLLGGLADGIGRRPTFLVCFVIYVAANIGLALSRNYASLLVVRCVQSAGSASTVALCQAVVADIVSSVERGSYIGITIIPIVFGPSLGPVLGGVLSEYLGWRAIFWFLAILGAVLGLGLALFLPETCRKIVGDGSVQPHPFHRTPFRLLLEWRRRKRAGPAAADADADAVRPPLRMHVPNPLLSVRLACQKNIGLLLLYSSLLFAGFYAVATVLPSSLAAAPYGLSEMQIGLCYLPVAAGSIVASFAVGPALNRNYRRLALRHGLIRADEAPAAKGGAGPRQHDLSHFPIETARLQAGLPLYALSTAIMLAWGWAVQRQVHLAVLCVLLFLNGVGMIGFQNAANTLLIDITPGRAGAAVAANNLTRCLVGAVATAVINPMVRGMGGPGWAFFVIGALYAATAPGIFLLMARGVAWRQAERVAEDRRRAKREAKKANKRRLKEGEAV